MKKKEIDKEGLNELIHLAKSLLKVSYVVFIIGIVLCSLLALKQIKIFPVLLGILKVISPLFIGFIIAWLFYPLLKKMIDKKMNKGLSVFLIMFAVIACIFIFIYVFIPVLYDQIQDLIAYVPDLTNDVTNFINNIFDKFKYEGIDIKSIQEGVINAGKNMIVDFTTNLPNNVVNIVKNFFSWLAIIALSLVVAVYMLIDFDNLRGRFHKILPKKNKNDYIALFDNIDTNARRVVNGTLFIAMLVFVFDTIGFAIIGLNASFLFGLFCGLTDLIPYIGPYIGGAAAVIVGFTQGPIIGLGVLIICAVVQILESYILQPMVMSKAMDLSPVTIIIGLLVFGYLFGIIGMIVATPCMAIIKEIVTFIKNKRKKPYIK